MPAPINPLQGTNIWATLLAGSGIGTVLAALINHFSKSKERADAKQKIETDAGTAHEKIEADASAARGRIEADALTAKEARVEEAVWKLINETRQHSDNLRAESKADIEAMSARIDTLTGEVANQKERTRIAEVLTSVANIRADNADADRRELTARLSVAMLQIEGLQRELAERDIQDHQRQGELREMLEKLLAAEKQLNEMSKSSTL